MPKKKYTPGRGLQTRSRPLGTVARQQMDHVPPLMTLPLPSSNKKISNQEKVGEI